MSCSQKIMLWNNDLYSGDALNHEFQPYLEVYPVKKTGGAVIVCPGGGYCNRAPHEGTPIAERFNSLGLTAFVLHYRVAPYRHPSALYDAARAIRIVRSRAAEWQVNPDKIAILGFSAGGHFTAHIGVHYQIVPEDPAYPVSCRPDAIIPCYSVINGHQGSFNNLLGENHTKEQKDFVLLDKQVHDNTPPAFLWHTFEDQSVPVQDSLDFCAALRRHNVPFELHVFPKGVHGIGLAEGNTAAVWTELCNTWLRSMGW